MIMMESPSNTIVLDVGSTIIKYFRIDPQGRISDGGYFPREYDQVVGDQVLSILKKAILWDPNRDKLRICSSANGGLTVGIVGLTARFSASWASRAALNAGANVRWAVDLNSWSLSPKTPVDILIIAGGMCNSPIENQLRWLNEVKTLPITYEAVVFAGNNSLSEIARKIWPNISISENVLGEDLSWQGECLAQLLRNAYLNDLVHKKGILGLQAHSEIAILPTPAVVQESYQIILNGNSRLHFLPPLLLIDVGGATTDIFYGSELISENSSNNPLPSINRHVFTHLGISTSRNSLIFELSNSEYLGDFLRAIDEKCAERNYLALREGITDWITPKILAEACCFLALKACTSGLYGGHQIEPGRISSIVITGGASQICNAKTLEKIFRICGVKNAGVHVDENYQIWMDGMLQINPIAIKGLK